MNAKLAKKIRKELFKQGIDIASVIFCKIGGKVSEGRMIYQKAKADAKSRPLIAAKYNPTHGVGIPSEGKSSKFKKFKENTLHWQKGIKRIVYDESMNPAKKDRRGIV